MLAALITKLESFVHSSGNLKISIENARKGNDSIIQDAVSQYKFLVEGITSYPLEAIKRANRERILDALMLLDAGLKALHVQECTRDGLKMLVERLWDLSNASSFLVKHSRFNWASGEE